MIKTAHSWFKLKKVLLENGINISKPLFHACKISVVQNILSEGLRSKAGHGDANTKNAICFSRSLDFYTNKNLALDWIWDKRSAIFIFEERDLKSRLKSRPYNWHYEKLDSEEKSLFTLDKKQLHEFEERYTVGDICVYGETVIPPKYIKAVILEVEDYFYSEVLFLDRNYKPINLLDLDLAKGVFDVKKEYKYMLPIHRDIIIENIDSIPKKGLEYLYVQASRGRDYELLKQLFNAGINFNITPLEEAVGKNEFTLTRFLVEHGMKPNLASLALAIEEGYKNIASLIIPYLKNELVDLYKTDILENYKSLKLAIRLGVPFNINDLCYIVSSGTGNINIYKLLLDLGINLKNIPNTEFYNFVYKLNYEEQRFFVKYGILKNERFVSYLKDKGVMFANQLFT